MKEVSLSKSQVSAILFAFEEELEGYGKLDRDAWTTARKLFKLFPKLKEDYGHLAWEVFPPGRPKVEK